MKIIDYDLDLREEAKKLLINTKYEVLLQKTSNKIRCNCYDNKYQEADSKCPKCLGTGWLFKFEKHKTFKQDESSNPIDGLDIIQAANINSNQRIFYFEHNVYPQIKDYIWEITWKNKRPYKLNELYKIKSVSDMRGETGKIEYFMVLADKEAIDKDFKNMHIGKAWRDIK